MAEAAAKEPSMEDILSSIRKIIADEGDGDVEPAQATGSADTNLKSDGLQHPSEEDAPQNPLSQPTETPGTADDNLHVPVEREPEPEVSAESAEESGTSLASIAASLQASSSVSEEVIIDEPSSASMQTHEPEPEVLTEPEISIEEEVSHVEMAEATPPSKSDLSTNSDSEFALAGASSQEMKREEDAFRGALMSPSADNAVTSSFDRLKRSAMDDIEAKTEAILRPMLREWLDENLPTIVERMVREEIERVARG